MAGLFGSQLILVTSFGYFLYRGILFLTTCTCTSTLVYMLSEVNFIILLISFFVTRSFFHFFGGRDGGRGVSQKE